MADLKFPSPHEVETIPGTEGWERMYPYHYQFSTDDPERKKYEEGHVLVLRRAALPGTDVSL